MNSRLLQNLHVPYGVRRPYNSRSNRHTMARYEEATLLQTQRNGRLWPRRWGLLGQRVIPLAIFIAALARRQQKADKMGNRLRGTIATLEARLERHQRLAAKTQLYISSLKARLDEAAAAGLTVSEFIDHERIAARRAKTS